METEFRIFEIIYKNVQKFGFLELISASAILGVVSFEPISVSVIILVDSSNYFLYLSCSGGFPNFISVSVMFRWIFLILLCTSAWVAACSCAPVPVPKPLEKRAFCR